MFKVVATLAGVLNLGLGALWFFNPQAIVALWGIEYGSPGLVIERRLAVLLMAISLILLFARNARPSPARSAVCYGAAFAATALSALGVYDWWSGAANSGILPGAGFNLFFGLMFAAVEWNARRERNEKERP